MLSVTLSGSKPSGTVLGVPVVWTASTGDHGASPVYQFSVGPSGGPLQVVRDFSTSSQFTWDPLREGSYDVRVTVKDGYDAGSGESTTESYNAQSRVTGSSAVISSTSNPLVALYSAPATSAGSSIRVQYRLKGTWAWQSTGSQKVVPGESTNLLVAGLRPNKTYIMRTVLNNGQKSTGTAFRTGSLPSSLKFPTFKLLQGAGDSSALSRGMVFHVGVNPPAGTVDTLATDRSGRIVWYFDPVSNNFPGYAPSLVKGGTVLMLGGQQDGIGGADTLREVNLAGDTLRETNVGAINAELAAMGFAPIANFNHDAERLASGATAVIVAITKTIDVNGVPTKYTGDGVLVLDQNFQVAWAWDPFQWIDTKKLPVLGEGPGDWLHANSIAWSPTDGNLIMSMRAQDAVIKINYASGNGDGHIVWWLGQGGDFTLSGKGASPWFSHQHDATYINDNTIILFDNGNTRHSKNPRANSRGQVIVLNEAARTAKLVSNVNLKNYAPAVGSAQRLPNGRLVFNSGYLQQTIEATPRGVITYILKMKMPGLQYRSYIYPTLYSAV